MINLKEAFKGLIGKYSNKSNTSKTINAIKQNLNNSTIPISNVDVTVDSSDPTKFNIKYLYTPYIPIQVTPIFLNPKTKMSQDIIDTHDFIVEDVNRDYCVCTKCNMTLYKDNMVLENLTCDEQIAKDIIK